MSSCGKRRAHDRSSDNKYIKSENLSDFSAAKKPKTDEVDESKSSNDVVVSCTTPTLYVSNLHNRVAEPHLEKLFQRFGEINRVNMIRKISAGGHHPSRHDSSSNRPHPSHRQQRRGTFSYAFVEFKSIHSANEAMNALNGVKLLGKDLIVKPANSKSTSGHSSDGLFSTEGLEMTDLSSAEVKKKKNDVESKIDALKRALREKQGK